MHHKNDQLQRPGQHQTVELEKIIKNNTISKFIILQVRKDFRENRT